MNPYAGTNAKADTHIFFGFQEYVSKIISDVAQREQYAQSFSILGGHKMGKTTLLHEIEQLIHKRGINISVETRNQIILPLYLDMLKVETTYEKFFSHLSHVLITCLDQFGLNATLSASIKAQFQLVETAQEPFHSFVEALDNLRRILEPGELRIMLLMDNLWHEKHKASEIYTLFGLLRALHTNFFEKQTVIFIISGSYQDFRQTQGSPLENLLKNLYLHIFSQEDAIKYINEPTGGKIPPEVAQQVYQETGGHPFLLQYLMFELCQHDDWTQLTTEDVTRAIEKFHREVQNFENWWGYFSREDWLVYDTLCQDEKHASADDVYNHLKNHNETKHKVTKPKVLDALHVLSTNGLIRETGDDEYALAGQWPAAWRRKRKAEEEGQ